MDRFAVLLILLWSGICKVATLPTTQSELPIGQRTTPIKVLTFNIWQDGANVNDGFSKIVKHIASVNADIVLLQEVQSKSSFAELLRLLNGTYKGVHRQGNYPDDAILVKSVFEVFPETMSQTNWAVTVMVREPVSQRNLSIWSIHLQYLSYGPYAACRKQTSDFTQILAGEFNLGYDVSQYPGRIQNTEELMQLPQFRRSVVNADTVPMILGGDLNCPSHQDWTEAAKSLHCNWEFAWPVTRYLDKIGLIDSYRSVHPDPVANPGTTWSAVEKFGGPDYGYTIPEPQDRIDMIFYMGTRLKPISSRTYEGTQPVNPKPHHTDNDYPSDHKAVVSEFLFSY